MFFSLEEWLPAFVLTVLAEGIVVVAGFRRLGTSTPRLALSSAFANLGAHPVG